LKNQGLRGGCTSADNPGRVMIPTVQHGWYGPIAALALAVGIGMGSVAAAQDKGGGSVFKWTDEKGVVHYGDSVPSQYSQNERSVLNNQGVEVGHVEGTGNNAATAERDRVAAIQRQREQHDQFLLSTYLSTKDIEQLRDERLGQVDGQIRASVAYIDSLGTRLTELEDQATHFKPYSGDKNARRMPDDLTEQLVRLGDETNNQRRALDAKRKELIDTRAQFEADIVRYRELTARPRS
jgi:uncharacterized protein DUF4124